MQDQNLSAKKNEELQFLHKTFLFYVLSRQTYFFRKRNLFLATQFFENIF